MGYATSYSLSIEKKNTQPAKSLMTIEQLIFDIKAGKKMTKKILLENLEEIAQPKPPEVTAYTLMEVLRSENEDAAYALTDKGGTRDSCKWYDHEDDLKSFSKKNPGWLFTLSGEGEEVGDIWKKYFIDGKMQISKAKIILEDFNPDNLV